MQLVLRKGPLGRLLLPVLDALLYKKNKGCDVAKQKINVNFYNNYHLSIFEKLNKDELRVSQRVFGYRTDLIVIINTDQLYYFLPVLDIFMIVSYLILII